MVVFGQNLYLWRTFRGLSQEDLAKKARLPRPNLSALENGKREPTLSTLRAIAINLGIKPGILVDGLTPLDLKLKPLSRKSLEKIVQISLGRINSPFGSKERTIATMLSKIIRNRINAKKKNYKAALKTRKEYIINWLMLKAALKTQTLNNLLSRIDKNIQLNG